ncbi:hypothetical protein FRAHR75_910016 [Frankia sp. Hr75.2]|nr:hypothetical protein FRAHR75_910016 [Frankia sp. Hr75.2]
MARAAGTVMLRRRLLGAGGDGVRRLTVPTPTTEGLFPHAGRGDTRRPGRIRRSRIENVGSGHCESYWERECRVEDLLLFRDVARSEAGAATLYAVTDDQPARSTRWREFIELQSPRGRRPGNRAVRRRGHAALPRRAGGTAVRRALRPRRPRSRCPGRPRRVLTRSRRRTIFRIAAMPDSVARRDSRG